MSVQDSKKTELDELQPKFEFHVIPETTVSPFLEDFADYKEGLARSEPCGFVMTPEFGRNVNEFIDFQTRKDDVWVVSFPKCGTTWTQEMVWMLMNNCDSEAAKQTHLTVRVPFIEVTRFAPIEELTAEFLEIMPSVSAIDKMPSPRILKSHLPFYLLPPKLLDTCKVVYVARNPKDVIVSYFHHHKIMKTESFYGDLEAFAHYFMKDLLLYSPFFPHILDAWAKRTHPNILILFYEDMKKDLRSEINKVARFLDISLTEEQMQKLLTHLKFENIAKNESVNFDVGKKLGFIDEGSHFMRKGKTGDWKNHFSPELNHLIDEWIRNNLEGTDLTFQMELEKQD